MAALLGSDGGGSSGKRGRGGGGGGRPAALSAVSQVMIEDALNAYWAAVLVDVCRSLRLALPHELPVGMLGCV